MQDYYAVKKALRENGICFSEKENMSLHTTFKIGGEADLFIEATDIDTTVSAINILREHSIAVTVIGKGSNILVSDNGIEGAVICLNSKDGIKLVDNNYISVFSGVSLTRLCNFAKDNSLTGLEFAYGIPGAVGGAVYMNAGAYDGCISDVLYSAECLMPDGTIKTFKNDQCDFGYRNSIFINNGSVILSAVFRLNVGEIYKITDKMNDLMSRRRAKQPLEYPSAGSTFKRPEGYYAGPLIEKSGLKGFSVGGAMVSEKHAGFVINHNNATCSDVLQLVEKIKNKVFSDSGVMLEPEIRKIGRI